MVKSGVGALLGRWGVALRGLESSIRTSLVLGSPVAQQFCAAGVCLDMPFAHFVRVS